MLEKLFSIFLWVVVFPIVVTYGLLKELYKIAKRY